MPNNFQSRSALNSRLPEIVSIGYTPCRLLTSDLMLQAMTEQIVAVSAPITTISIISQAVLDWEGDIVNHARVEKATLKFVTNDRLPEDEPIAFIIETAGKQCYLLGKKEARYPVIKYAETTGQRAGSRAARTYTITYTAHKAVLECMLWHAL